LKKGEKKMNRNLLLISNSTLHGGGYLDHCSNEISVFLNNKKNVLFIPFARPGGISYQDYTNIAHERFNKIGYNLTGIQEYDNPNNAIDEADALFIGGGNTFVLLNSLYKSGIIDKIRNKVKTGMLYIGTSAGSNVACKSIMTTNDMPIVYPPSFLALNLVNFNLNPHYIDPDPNSKHMGETREMRIKEFHEYNSDYVVGLREGSMLYIKDNKAILKGNNNARIFKNNCEPYEVKSGDNLNFLLNE
jgi:dipeptidase E